MNYDCKKTILSLLVLLTAHFTKAQSEYLVTVNPLNGTITKIDSISEVRWIRGGYMGAYSQQTHQYTLVEGLHFLTGVYKIITVDAITGHTVFNTELINHLNFSCLQYGNNNDILYGAVNSPSVSLVVVNPSLATHTLLRNCPEMTVILKLFPDNANNKMYISAGDASANGGRAIFVVEMSTGNILSKFPVNNILNLEYSYSTNTFYGLYSQTGGGGNPATFTFCRIDPNTGIRTNIATIPGIYNPAWGNETLDESGGRYFIAAPQLGDTNHFLNTIDITTGNLLNKVIIPESGDSANDNLALFRYDKGLNKLYALFWEAKTIISPPIPPIDSTCRLDAQTKFYPNPIKNILYIDKKPTTCRVTMNIYNMIGQLVVKGKAINDGFNEIYLTNLSSGVYNYTLISNENILLSGRFLKQ